VVQAREGVIGISSCVVGIDNQGQYEVRGRGSKGCSGYIVVDPGKRQGFGGIVDLV